MKTEYANLTASRRDVMRGAAGVGAAALMSSSVLSARQAEAAATPESNAIRPFHIKTPKEALVDLRKRIDATKFPERETVADAS